MKLAYMAWFQKVQVSELIITAINKTIEQQKQMVIQELRAFKLTSSLQQDVAWAKQQDKVMRQSFQIQSPEIFKQ